ncbi:MAG: hypothetical protein KAQ83_00765 [Nanoarchaeota archaeon]|nr:hypothetical protein [Nanoarchaeota archaeon]
MTKFGLKRIPSPKTWDIKKKKIRFTTRPLPGPFKFNESLTLTVILRDYLNFVNTMREAKFAVNNNEILINNKRRKDVKNTAGFMDVISFPKMDQYFRLNISKKGKIIIYEIKKTEADLVPSKIKGIKIANKETIQISLAGGKNILTKKKGFKPGDSLILSAKDNKIIEHIKLEKGAFIILTAGKHVGEQGVIETIEGNNIIFKTKEGTELETKKRYAYALGKGKSSIKLDE